MEQWQLDLADNSQPDTLVLTASMDLMSRVLAEVFGADFDRINSKEVTLGDTSPPKFLEAIAIALGGDALSTPLPGAVTEGFGELAEAIETAGTDIARAIETHSAAIENVAEAIKALSSN